MISSLLVAGTLPKHAPHTKAQLYARIYKPLSLAFKSITELEYTPRINKDITQKEFINRTITKQIPITSFQTKNRFSKDIITTVKHEPQTHTPYKLQYGNLPKYTHFFN